MRDLLCQSILPPPPTLDTAAPAALDPNDPNFGEKMTLQHGSREGCKGCHARIDPVGLSLQAFDALGAFTGHKVDFAALGIEPRVLAGINDDVSEIRTQDQANLVQSMAESSVFRRCFARNLTRYLVGRQLAEEELALADQLAEQLLRPEDGAKDSVMDFAAAIVQHPQFFVRAPVPTN